MVGIADCYDFSGRRVFLFQARDIANTNFTPIPYGLACIGAVLQEAGAEVIALDQNAPYINSSLDYLLEKIREQKPDFIGLRLSITAVFSAHRIIKEIKKEFKAIPVIVGGPHATMRPGEVLDIGADFVVMQEGEIIILNLINALIHKEDLTKVKGIVYRKPNGIIISTPEQPQIDNLDILPLPAKSLFKKEDYIRTESDLKNFACIFSSRGCSGKCSFCAARILGKGYRYRSASGVLKEIRYLYDNYGITHFNFMDDSFTVKKKRVIQLCRRIIDELDFKISFICHSIINHVDLEILKMLKEAGCANIIYGVERIDKETQKKIHKGYKIEQVERIIENTIDLGIGCFMNFMFGFPWDTEKLIDENLQFMKRYYSKVHFNMSGVVVPYPGTELYCQVKDKFGIANWWLEQPPRLADEDRPFFRRKVLCDDSIINRNFFNYSKQLKKKIRKIYWWITWNNARCDFKGNGLASWIKAIGKLALFRLSQFLFFCNPALEKKVFIVIRKFIKKGNGCVPR